MIDRINLLAVTGGIVKCFAKCITNQRLKATAGMTIVDLPGVVGRSACGDEVRVVAERNDSEFAVRQHRIATGSTRQVGARRQSDSTKRSTSAQDKRIVRADVHITL